MGDEYTERLRHIYRGRIPASADLVCCWFYKAGRLVAEGETARAGLIATSSIRGGTNRAVLDRIVERNVIFDDWADEPWAVAGAAVRVSLICLAPKDAGLLPSLNGTKTAIINSDLTAGSIGLAQATQLTDNKDIAFIGNTKGGLFDISGDLARGWLRLRSNPNGRPNADILKPWVNGTGLTRRPAGKWIVDFGWSMSETEAALYEEPFQHVKCIPHAATEPPQSPSRQGASRASPPWCITRQRNHRKAHRDYWWRHAEPRQGMWRAFDGRPRYITTPHVARHRLFVWRDIRVCPDCQLIVIARDDDTTFGILHSRFHEAWALRLGTSLGDGPRYTPTTTFETFPFPEGLTPNGPASDCANDPRTLTIAEATRRLVELRDRWINPPEWVDEPVSGYPKRPVPRGEAAAKALEKRTLTTLYNARPQWLADAHAALAAAVAAAYGWSVDISDADALRELLALSLTRSG